MKKFSHPIAAFVLISMLFNFLGAFTPVQAAPLRDQTGFSFTQLGSDDIIMHGPYDTSHLRFSLPANWVLQEGSQLQLNISAYFSGDSSTTVNSGDFLGAMLDVYFNDKLQESIPLKAGANMLYQIPLSVASLPSARTDGALEISFFLNASIDCMYGYHHTTVAISAASQLLTQYAQTSLHLDLRRLPWPLFEVGSVVPASSVVVVPTSPSASEIRAALLVMAAFGRMTDQKLPISLITTDQLVESVRENSDLIFVGKLASLPVILPLQLPVPVSNAHFNSPGMQNDDGVMEMAVSPWNASRTLLVVSGNTDAGVVKAAQSFTTNNIQVADSPSYSVVAQVNPIASTGIITPNSTLIPSADFTLAQLGYDVDTVSSIGVNWLSYEFTIPPGQVATENPYMDLNFSNSALLDSTRSGLVIYLNGQLVGSQRFQDNTTNNITGRINLPISLLRMGNNKIDIEANLTPRDVCSAFSFNGMWLTVFADSTIHLPLATATATSNALQDLHTYPYPFVNDPSLTTTTFVLPQNDASAWANAGGIAYNLGGQAVGNVLSFDVSLDGQVTDAVRKSQNLILVGLPQELATLSDLKDSLPAHFDPGSNAAVLDNQQVVYRLSPTKSLGYLELLPSPWNDQLAILAILGTTPDGLGFASNGLIDDKIRNTLKGNFGMVDEGQALVVDTRTGLGMGRITASNSPATVDIQTPQAPANVPSQLASGAPRGQIIIALGLIVFLIVLVLVIAVLFRRRNPGSNR